MDPFGIAFKYLTVSGLVSDQPIAVKAIYSMHAEGATGSIKFYNLGRAPLVGELSVGQIDIVGKGTETFTIPERGALFDKGLYMELPAAVSVNVFYKDARYA